VKKNYDDATGRKSTENKGNQETNHRNGNPEIFEGKQRERPFEIRKKRRATMNKNVCHPATGFNKAVLSPISHII